MNINTENPKFPLKYIACDVRSNTRSNVHKDIQITMAKEII